MAGAGVWSVFVFVKLSSKLNSRSIVWITSIRSSSGTVSIIGVTKSTAKSYELRSELVELWTFCCCCKIRSSRICSSFSFLSLFSIVLLMSDSRIETLSRMSGSSSVVVTVVGGFVVVVVVGVVVQNDVVLMTSGSTFSGVVVVQNGVVVVVFLDIPSVLAAVEPAVLTLLRSICTCCRPFALSFSVSITWPRVCCCCSVSIGSPVGYKVIKMDKHGINNLSLFYYLLLQNPTLPLSRMITFWSASAAMRPTRRHGLSPPGSNFVSLTSTMIIFSFASHSLRVPIRVTRGACVVVKLTVKIRILSSRRKLNTKLLTSFLISNLQQECRIGKFPRPITNFFVLSPIMSSVWSTIHRC